MLTPSRAKNRFLDFQFPLVVPPFGPPGIHVEQGFLKAYMSLRRETLSAIKSARASCGDGCEILFTGHSLGGVIATLAAADVAEEAWSGRVQLYTFASPRVGDAAWAGWASGVLQASSGTPPWRMRRQLDMVPALPPQSMGYAHVGTEIWNKFAEGEPDAYVICDGSGEDPSCGDSEETPAFPLYLVNLRPSQHVMYMGVKGGRCSAVK